MIRIGQHVKYAIDAYTRREFLLAFEQACIALDMTAKNYYNSHKSTAKNYQNLLKEYLWLLELMSFSGINLEESTFGNFSFVDSHDKQHDNPSMQEILYHIVRCSLIHGDQSDQIFRFHQEDSIFLGKDILMLPYRVLWGLLGVVVFCKANKNETTADGYYLSIYNRQYDINMSWGIEELIHTQYLELIKNSPRVKLNILKEHFYKTFESEASIMQKQA